MTGFGSADERRLREKDFWVCVHASESNVRYDHHDQPETSSHNVSFHNDHHIFFGQSTTMSRFYLVTWCGLPGTQDLTFSLVTRRNDNVATERCQIISSRMWCMYLFLYLWAPERNAPHSDINESPSSCDRIGSNEWQTRRARFHGIRSARIKRIIRGRKKMWNAYVTAPVRECVLVRTAALRGGYGNVVTDWFMAHHQRSNVYRAASRDDGVVRILRSIQSETMLPM